MRTTLEDYTRFPVGPPIAGGACDPLSLGYVYVVGFDEPGIVKIGSAQSMVARLLALQCGNPFELKLLAAVSIYEGDPQLIEFAAHRLAADANIRGEWFELDTEEALRVIIRAARNAKAKFGASAEFYDQDMAAISSRTSEAETERLRLLRQKLGIEAE